MTAPNSFALTFIERMAQALRDDKRVFDIARDLQRTGDALYAYEKHMAWVAQTVHQAYHTDVTGVWQSCKRDVCASTQTILTTKDPL